ncbi:MAG: hypothetical protein H0W01_00045 [Pseudonocardiales bacterium]|nr:hypothetical protein [Pseudonocardiales bacterium]
MTAHVTTDSVDYLQRNAPTGVPAAGPIPGGTATAGAPESRRVWHVRGVGVRVADHQPAPPSPPGQRWRARTAELVTGMSGQRIPLAFRLDGAPDAVRVQLGTWSSGTGSGAGQDRRAAAPRPSTGSSAPR